MEVSLMEGLQQVLEQRLGAPPQKLAEYVVEDHFGPGDFAAEPEEVVFPEGHLELAVVLEDFHLLLHPLLPAPQPTHHHSPLQLPQHLPGRVPGILAGQLRPDELAVVRDPGEHDVAGTEAGLVPLGGSVEIEGSQSAISGSIDVDHKAVGSLGLDDADEEVVLLGEVGRHLLAEVDVALGCNLVLDHQPVVETLEMSVSVDEGLGVGLGLGQVDLLVRQHHPVVELLLHYKLFLIYDSFQITKLGRELLPPLLRPGVLALLLSCLPQLPQLPRVAANFQQPFGQPLPRLEHEAVVLVPYQLGEGREVDCKHGDACPEHVNHLHGKVQSRAGVVQADPQVADRQQHWVVVGVQPQGCDAYLLPPLLLLPDQTQISLLFWSLPCYESSEEYLALWRLFIDFKGIEQNAEVLVFSPGSAGHQKKFALLPRGLTVFFQQSFLVLFGKGPLERAIVEGDCGDVPVIPQVFPHLV